MVKRIDGNRVHMLNRLVVRVFLSLLLLFVFSHSGWSQKFTLGARAGGNFNWAGFIDKDQKDTFSTKPIAGYSAAFQIGFPMKKKYDLLLEAGFTKRGRRLFFQSTQGGQWENRSSMSFLDATMLLRKSFPFQLGKNVPADWFFLVGPEVSYWSATKNGTIFVNGFEMHQYSVAFDQTRTGDYNIMYYEEPNRWLFGLVLGVGMKAPLKNNQRIAVDARFISGHTILSTKPGYMNILGFDDTMKTNMKSVNLSVTYFYDFDVIEGRKGKSTLKKKLKKSR